MVGKMLDLLRPCISSFIHLVYLPQVMLFMAEAILCVSVPGPRGQGGYAKITMENRLFIPVPLTHLAAAAGRPSRPCALPISTSA